MILLWPLCYKCYGMYDPNYYSLKREMQTALSSMGSQTYGEEVRRSSNEPRLRLRHVCCRALR